MDYLDNGVTAHRGGSLEFPENTLTAFTSAMNLGVDWIEIDVRLTLDGKLVVIHDVDTARVAEVQVSVAEATFQELRALDMAYQFRKNRRLSIDQCPRQQIPELCDVLNLLARQHGTRLSVQPKAVESTDNRDDIIRETIKLARSSGVSDRIGFNDGSGKHMALVKSIDTNIPVFWDIDATEDNVAMARDIGIENVVMPKDMVSPEKVELLKKAGIIPGAWIVNEQEEMEKLVQWGVYRIYTDAPTTLLEIKKLLQ